MSESKTVRHLLTLRDLTTAEIERIFEIAEQLKDQLRRGTRERLLPGRVAGLLFEKPSLRTRVSFETAMVHLGGASMYLGTDVGWGQRESTSDFARVISEYVDVVVYRGKSHATLQELARYASCPVINGLTDLDHPCQALADLFTIREVFGSVRGRKLAFVGDANNVARSLLLGSARLGARFAIASPPGYAFDREYVAEVRRLAPGFEFLETDDPQQAVRDADAVYTDVWASMGQESEQSARAKAFAPYQVNQRLMASAPPRAVFLHCLPARRGQEVTDEVIDSPQSAVVQQAGNRMHVQKALLLWLLAELE